MTDLQERANAHQAVINKHQDVIDAYDSLVGAYQHLADVDTRVDPDIDFVTFSESLAERVADLNQTHQSEIARHQQFVRLLQEQMHNLS